MREERARPSLEEKQVLPVIVLDPWMQPIVTYLADGILLEGRAEAAKLEILAGDCGAHEGAVTLYRKAMLQGFYWPTMKKDAEEMVKKCDKCQRFGSLIRTPTAHQSTIGSPWPFIYMGSRHIGSIHPCQRTS
ncbi:uncharacterized protein LOC126670619 [Mercurialis annua]|uniref:uncharacterized protein LOC126670619 n=1 Tax=Mercurialis annua TaxID=3986 RepID=UPI002160DE15|nr:uncharacterized protein LOC126670619 [Mercurialis annua]